MRTFLPRSMMVDMSDIFFAFLCRRDGKGYTMLGECVRNVESMPTRVRVGMAPDDSDIRVGVEIEAQPYSRSGVLVMIELAEGTTPTTPHPPDRRNLPPLSFAPPEA